MKTIFNISKAIGFSAIIASLILMLASCSEYHIDYIVTDKYFSPKQYTKVREPGFKGGYYDTDTYIPDTYILIYRQVCAKCTHDKYEPFSKSFYDKVNIGDTICFYHGKIYPCSFHQLKINNQLNK
jgi:hypothetical protein